MRKIFSIALAALLAASVLSVIGAAPTQAINGQDQYVPDDDQDLPDQPKQDQYKGNYTEDSGKYGAVPGISEGIGERVKQIAKNMTQQIRKKVKSGNFTGKEIAGIAKQMGTRVKTVAMAHVQEMKNKTQQKMEKAKNRSKAAEMALKAGKASKYDYAYDKFTTKAQEMIKEAKERGIDVEEMNETLENVSTTYAEMYESENPEQKAEEMKQLAQKFREKFQNKTGNQAEEIKNQAKQRIQNQTKSLQQMRNHTWNNMQNMAKTVFENRVKSAENRINAVKNNLGLNTSDLEAKLQEIKDKKTELEQAYEAKNRTQVKQVTQEIKTLWKEFRNMYQKTHREQVMDKTMERVEDTLNKTEQLMNQAQNKGLSTAEVNASQEGIENGLEKAKQAIQNQNYGTAKQHLRDVKKNFTEYRDKIQGLAKQMKNQGGQ